MFTYKTSEGFDHMLEINTLDGLTIEVGFDGLDATHVYLNGHEKDLKTDDIKGLYADLGKTLLTHNFKTIAEIVALANQEIDSIVDENTQDDEDAQNHIKDMCHQGRYL
jgi:hypothetical protein